MSTEIINLTGKDVYLIDSKGQILLLRKVGDRKITDKMVLVDYINDVPVYKSKYLKADALPPEKEGRIYVANEEVVKRMERKDFYYLTDFTKNENGEVIAAKGLVCK